MREKVRNDRMITGEVNERKVSEGIGKKKKQEECGVGVE